MILYYLLIAAVCLGAVYGIRRITGTDREMLVESGESWTASAEAAGEDAPEIVDGGAESGDGFGGDSGVKPGSKPGAEDTGEEAGARPGSEDAGEEPGSKTGEEGTGEEPGAESGAGKAGITWHRWDREKDRQEAGEGPSDKDGERTKEEGPPKMIIATDLHLLAKELMDGGAVFQARMAKDDGKTTLYSSEIIEAFLEEVLDQKPDVLVLSGDLSFEGDKASHQELARMLAKVQEAGIQVLVLPGNHDINNPRAAAYLADDEEVQAEPVTPEEFEEIYDTYGFEQAISRDEASLSYLYPLREDIWLMLLDTNQYEPVNEVAGDIKPETYQWMIEVLEKAKAAGISVIPVGHHNLLQESRLYTDDCVIRSHASAVWLFGEYRIPLYLSGHLHVQRFKKHKAEPGVPEDAYGVHEIVTGSLGMSPHSYGVITWDEEGRMMYQVERVDVETWAEETGSLDENLLNFGQYSRDWYHGIIEGQVYKKMGSFPEDSRRAMARLYADILYRYGAGEWIDKQEVENSEAYGLWERLMGGEELFREIRQMLADLPF